MSRNITNLLFALGLLAMITACVCRSNRETAVPPPALTESPSPGQTKETTSNTAASDANEDKGDFKVEHVEIKDSNYQTIDKQIRGDKVLEKAAVRLNAALKLPRDVILRTNTCGKANAFYDPNDASVTVCYELMDYFYQLFRKNGESEENASKKMSAAVQFVFLHEIGHALVDIYELPVMANEEDAADRCSSYINIKELGDDGVNAVLAAAEAFRIESQGRVPEKRRMADEHLLKEQRFYNALCMIYGSNVRKYAYIVDDGFLPEERAVRCPTEWEKTSDSWEKLLAPWRKQQ